MASACNSNTYAPRETGALLLASQKSRKLAIVCKSQEEHIPKKLSIIYPLNKGRQPSQFPCSAKSTN
jgi:hypothetical protein